MRGRRPGIVDRTHREEDHSEIADLDQDAVQGGLVGDGTPQRRRPVRLASHRQVAEPLGPAIIEVPADTHFVARRVRRESSPSSCSDPGLVSGGADDTSGCPTDDPLGDSEIDRPARTVQQSDAQLALAEDALAEAEGEHLGGGAEPDGEGADHPCAVPRESTLSNGTESEDDAQRQPGRGQKPEDEQQRRVVRQGGECQPYPRAGGEQGCQYRQSAGDPVPGRPASPKACRELESAEDDEDGRPDDVQNDRERHPTAVAGRRAGCPDGQSDSSERVGEDGDQPERDQPGREQPADAALGAPAGHRASGWEVLRLIGAPDRCGPQHLRGDDCKLRSDVVRGHQHFW